MEQKETTSSFLKGILDENNELLTPVLIEDQNIRKALIGAALNLEKMLKENKINVGTDIPSKNPMGLEIKCRAEQPKAEKPHIYYFTYSVNSDTLKGWIKEHGYLDGMWKFNSRGIQIAFSGGGVENYHKVLYFIKCSKSEESPEGLMYLDLLVKDTTFAAHRDVFSTEEWIISRIS